MFYNVTVLVTADSIHLREDKIMHRYNSMSYFPAKILYHDKNEQDTSHQITRLYLRSEQLTADMTTPYTLPRPPAIYIVSFSSI